MSAGDRSVAGSVRCWRAIRRAEIPSHVIDAVTPQTLEEITDTSRYELQERPGQLGLEIRGLVDGSTLRGEHPAGQSDMRGRNDAETPRPGRLAPGLKALPRHLLAHTGRSDAPAPGLSSAGKRVGWWLKGLMAQRSQVSSPAPATRTAGHPPVGAPCRGAPRVPDEPPRRVPATTCIEGCRQRR